MTKILDKKQIRSIIQNAAITDLIACIEKAFTSYSNNNAIVPPVGTLSFENPPGDMHIKYGYIKNADNYVVKIASGFYKNPEIGISSSNGLNLVFNQKTGILETILLDEGYLTDIRTALAGAISAKYMAPAKINSIGIIGTGIQARLQLQYLKDIVDCRKVIVWGRNFEKLNLYEKDMYKEGFEIKTTTDCNLLAEKCNLIVATTASDKPILLNDKLQPGTHITAMGADTIGKQELDVEILKRANIIVVDSIKQCQKHGEIHKAYKHGLLNDHNIIELGDIISSNLIKRDNNDITVVDLTGIATQDIQISNFVLSQL
ncbi:MAG: ornithine cyclodeaminase family protein [Saprospiraceae bacterium]|nr:ornithine cyclodeaminase family protein [Saprospiraceae bacterium]